MVRHLFRTFLINKLLLRGKKHSPETHDSCVALFFIWTFGGATLLCRTVSYTHQSLKRSIFTCTFCLFFLWIIMSPLSFFIDNSPCFCLFIGLNAPPFYSSMHLKVKMIYDTKKLRHYKMLILPQWKFYTILYICRWF